MTLVEERFLRPLQYFSTRERSLLDATSFVVMVTPFTATQMQSTLTLDLYDLNKLLMHVMCSLTWFRILSQSFSLIDMRIFFLDGPLVVIWVFLFLAGE